VGCAQRASGMRWHTGVATHSPILYASSLRLFQLIGDARPPMC
jgi:hypothetical protein